MLAKGTRRVTGKPEAFRRRTMNRKGMQEPFRDKKHKGLI